MQVIHESNPTAPGATRLGDDVAIPAGYTPPAGGPSPRLHGPWWRPAARDAAPAPARGGWFTRIGRALALRSERVPQRAAARQAALAGEGPGVLGALSRLSLRLHGLVGTLQHRVQQAADARALAQATTAVHAQFAARAADAAAFNELLRSAFGDRFDATKAESIRQQALAGDFSWAPRIVLMDSAALGDTSGTQGAGSAMGAYAAASDTIYLSRELLRSDPAQARRILMEELGHAIDARINTVDAAGDEGEIFSRLVNGDKLSASELAALRADNDSGTVTIGGRSVTVEYGWFKKLVKAVTGGIKKVVKAVVGGAVNVLKAGFKVATGVLTLNFDRVREGLSDGVRAVVDTAKTVVRAVRDTTKAVLQAAKEAFKSLMKSQLFAAVLMVCRFIPIPVVQVVVRVIDIVRAAYMAYQAVKNKSWSAALGAVAGAVGGAGNLAASLGASAATVSAITNVADAASKLSMAYNVVARQDLGAALGLLGGAVGGNAQLATAVGYAQQAVALHGAIRSGDALAAVSGGLALAGQVSGNGDSRTLANVQEVLTGARAVQSLAQGNLDAAQSLTAGMSLAQRAGAEADAIMARNRAQQDTTHTAAAPADSAGTTDAEAADGAADAEQPAATAQGGSDAEAEATPPASEAPDAPAAPASRTLTVRSGQTLEGIARANYGENWRAGLTQIMADNNIRMNQWGSPMIRAGQELTITELSNRTEQDIAAMARTGGRVVATNSAGLQAKAELEERARQAAALKIAEAERMAAAQAPFGGELRLASYDGSGGGGFSFFPQAQAATFAGGAGGLGTDASDAFFTPSGLSGAAQGMADAGRRTLVNNPILVKIWEPTMSAWTGKGGFTPGLTSLLTENGIDFRSTPFAAPAGSVGRGSGVSVGVANNINGALAENATAARYANAGTVTTLQARPQYGRIVDVVVDVPAADPRMSQRIEIESKVGRTGLDGANGRITSEVLRDGQALLDNRTLRSGGQLLENVGRVARPVGIVMDAVEVGQAFRADGNRIGTNTGRAASGVAGGALGGWGGAAGGAALGTMILPGPGTVIGGIIGGIAGAWGGDKAARAGFDAVQGH